MTRRVSALKVRRNLGELLERVRLGGERIVVERAGRPMAVIVPLEFFESWERRQEELFDTIDEIRARNRRRSPAAIEREVLAAQQAVRRRKR